MFSDRLPAEVRIVRGERMDFLVARDLRDHGLIVAEENYLCVRIHDPLVISQHKVLHQRVAGSLELSNVDRVIELSQTPTRPVNHISLILVPVRLL